MSLGLLHRPVAVLLDVIASISCSSQGSSPKRSIITKLWRCDTPSTPPTMAGFFFMVVLCRSYDLLGIQEGDEWKTFFHIQTLYRFRSANVFQAFFINQGMPQVHWSTWPYFGTIRNISEKISTASLTINMSRLWSTSFISPSSFYEVTHTHTESEYCTLVCLVCAWELKIGYIDISRTTARLLIKNMLHL